MVQKRRTSPKSVSPSTVSSTALPAAAYHTTASNGEAQHTTARCKCAPRRIINAPSNANATLTALITHILQTEGIRGLYRGFLTSIFTYAPSSAVWWGTQNLSKKVFGRLFHTEQTNHKNIDGILGQNTLKHFGISALSGFTAGCVAACVTNPLVSSSHLPSKLSPRSHSTIGRNKNPSPDSPASPLQPHRTRPPLHCIPRSDQRRWMEGVYERDGSQGIEYGNYQCVDDCYL